MNATRGSVLDGVTIPYNGRTSCRTLVNQFNLKQPREQTAPPLLVRCWQRTAPTVRAIVSYDGMMTY
jgi:hypothetical protein